MGLAFSTAGVKIKYKVETTAGSRPTGSYITLPDIKSTPDFNAEPSTLDTTTFEATEWKTSIPGLKDVGGAVAFTANLTTSVKTAWNSCVSAASTARGSGLSTWFEVAIPNFDSFYFAGIPSEMGMKGMGVDEVAEIDLYVTPEKFEGWASAST